jgi:hypothetical protein
MNIINYKEFKPFNEDKSKEGDTTIEGDDFCSAEISQNDEEFKEENIVQEDIADIKQSVSEEDEFTKKVKRELRSVGTFAIIIGWFFVTVPLFFFFLLIFFVSFSFYIGLLIMFLLIPGISGAITFIVLGRRIKKGADIKILNYLKTLRIICYLGLFSSIMMTNAVGIFFGGLIFFIICLTQISPAISMLRKGMQNDNFYFSLVEQEYEKNWLIKLATSITIVCLSSLLLFRVFPRLNTENLIEDSNIKKETTYDSKDSMEKIASDTRGNQRRAAASIKRRNKMISEQSHTGPHTLIKSPKQDLIEGYVRQVKKENNFPFKIDKLNTWTNITAEKNAVRIHTVVAAMESDNFAYLSDNEPSIAEAMLDNLLGSEFYKDALKMAYCQDQLTKDLHNDGIGIEFLVSIKDYPKEELIVINKEDCLGD